MTSNTRRLTLVIPSLAAGGAERVASLLADRWVERGHAVTLITLAAAGEDHYAVDPRIRRIDLGRAWQVSGPARALRANVKLRGLLRRAVLAGEPDCVVSFIDEVNVRTLTALVGTGIPLVISERTDPRRHHRTWTWRWRRRLLYPFADALVVQTAAVERWAAETLHARTVRVIPNPVSPPPPASGFPRRAPTVIAVGRLGVEKGVDLLLEAFARSGLPGHGWRLQIVGDGRERPALERRALAPDLAGHVEFTGVTRDIFRLLSQAAVFALPSRFEGFPNALLEAMACGLAVVAFDCDSGPRAIVRHGHDGLLVPPEDVAALSRALDTLAADEALRGRLGAAARGVVDRYGIDDVAAQWERLVDQVVARRRPGGAREATTPCGVTLLIRSLDVGGAQRQLVNLAVALHRDGVRVDVLAFYPGGALRSELEAAGVPVSDLAKRGRWDVVPFLARLRRHLRRRRPATLYSFLPTANVLAVAVRPLAPSMRVVWGVRASHMDLGRYGTFAGLEFRLQCRLSRRADLVIANSEAGRRYHVARGFPAARVTVVPNGIDLDRFARADAGRRTLRGEWGIDDAAVLFGLVARLDPMKDHVSFLQAGAHLFPADDRVRFVCVGDGPRTVAAGLRATAERLGLGDRVVWTGGRSDLVDVYSALDVLVSSSSGEGFPNAVGEAMACEVPCVVTDVGDSAWIVGDTGLVVPAGDPGALARAMAVMAERSPAERAALGARARARIAADFGVDALAKRTLGLLDRDP
jgi:glycosyltransferase involved in cell wall biosynthesis